MEGLPKTPQKEESLGSETIREIESIQKGRDLSVLSVKELNSIKEKYIKLKEELGISNQEGLQTSYEQAEVIMGESFYGSEEITSTLGFEFPKDRIPPIPYSPEFLEKAKELGELLMLRVEDNGSGVPMTMSHIKTIMESRMDKDEEGKLFYDQNWYKEEPFFKESSLKTEWRLVSKEFVPDTTSKNYIQQTRLLRDYLLGLESLSEEEKEECTDDLLNELQDMLDKDPDGNWKEVAKKLSDLSINKNHSRIPVEVIYDWVLQFKKTKGRGILERNYDWTGTLSSGGRLVSLGRADVHGVSVGDDGPGHRGGTLGVVSLR